MYGDMWLVNILKELWLFVDEVIVILMQKGYPMAVEPMPDIPAPTPEPVKKDMLLIFCSGIRDFEGQPGDLSYRNNNPGNVRCSPVGYASRYGSVKCVNNFSVFTTYELGWEYLQSLVHQRALLFPDWTILDFIGDPKHGYSPASDGNPVEKYAQFLADRCGVPVTATLGQLFA